MCYESLPVGKSRASLWAGYILFGECAGIRPCEGDCPTCGSPLCIRILAHGQSTNQLSNLSPNCPQKLWKWSKTVETVETMEIVSADFGVVYGFAAKTRRTWGARGRGFKSRRPDF